MSIVSGHVATVTASPSAGPPASNTVAFTWSDQIADGETLTVTVQHPDGTSENRIFTAVAGTPANPGEFQIGADADATAANFRTAFADLFHDNSVTIAEDGDHPFGIKLDGISTNSSDISVLSQTTTQPHVLQVTRQRPAGRPETRSASPTRFPTAAPARSTWWRRPTIRPMTVQFLIGADADATAANLPAP